MKILNCPLEVNTLPTSLIKLKLGYKFNHRIGPNVLPESLLQLIFSAKINNPLEIGSLPKKTDKIKIL